MALIGLQSLYIFLDVLQNFPWIEADEHLSALKDSSMTPLKMMSSDLIKVRLRDNNIIIVSKSVTHSLKMSQIAPNALSHGQFNVKNVPPKKVFFLNFFLRSIFAW